MLELRIDQHDPFLVLSADRWRDDNEAVLEEVAEALAVQLMSYEVQGALEAVSGGGPLPLLRLGWRQALTVFDAVRSFEQWLIRSPH